MAARLLPALFLSAACLLAGCYQVPVTGRRAVNIVNEKQVTELSVAEFEKMKATYPRSRNADHLAALNRVGERISKVKVSPPNSVVSSRRGSSNSVRASGG